MKAPFYKLEKDEDSEALSEILLSDGTPLHFKRCRAGFRADYWVMSDSFIRGVFEKPDEKIFNYDDLYVVYDKNGSPVCVSVNGDGARILYSGAYIKITANKIKITDNPRELYLAYLDMFPRSALDMDKFVSQRKKYFLAPENCLYDGVWSAVTEVGNKICLSLNAAKSGVGIWKLHKILFELDKNFRILTVYSAVGKTYGKYVTRADVVNRGDAVLRELEKTADSNRALKEKLENIL